MGALEEPPVPNPVNVFGEEGEHATSTVQVTPFTGWYKQHALPFTLCLFLP